MLRRRDIFAVLLGMILTLGLTAPAGAAIPDGDASSFVQRLGDEALATLVDAKLDEETRAREFRRLLLKGFAMKGIARFVLGQHWNTASAEEREDYLRLFETYIVKTYSAKLAGYSGEFFKILGERADGEGRIVVSEIHRPAGDPVKVQWRVREGPEALKIVDVIIEGVSMAITQRSEFSSVIQRHGGKVPALLDELRRKVNALD